MKKLLITAVLVQARQRNLTCLVMLSVVRLLLLAIKRAQLEVFSKLDIINIIYLAVKPWQVQEVRTRP